VYERRIIPNLKEALADNPVVLVNGARQTGKTTLVQQFVPVLGRPNASAGVSPHEDPPRSYLTLDDPTVLASSRADPVGFIAGIGGATVIDEVQRAPELFSAIKMSVDRDHKPGRFLLKGSEDILLLPGHAFADGLGWRALRAGHRSLHRRADCAIWRTASRCPAQLSLDVEPLSGVEQARRPCPCIDGRNLRLAH
jgi:hypothetical protein